MLALHISTILGARVKFSHTRLSTWRRCRQRYSWDYVAHLPKDASAGQLKGRAGHAALAAWYRGASESQAIALAMVQLQGLGQEGAKTRELMVAVLQRYFAWARLNDPRYWSKVLHTELHLEGKIGGHDFQVYVDMIVETPTGLLVVDHKFQQNGHIEGALQAPQLAMGAELIHQNTGVRPTRVMFNVIRTVLGGQSVVTPVIRTMAQIIPERHQLWRREAAAQADEIERFHQGGAGAPAVFRNQTNDCSWDCAFYQRCLGLDTGGTVPETIDTLVIVDDVTGHGNEEESG